MENAKFLTLSQCDKLTSLGIDMSDASMYYWLGIENEVGFVNNSTTFTINENGKYSLNGKEMCVPTYIFQDIWNKLPKTHGDWILRLSESGIYWWQFGVEDWVRFNSGNILTDAFNMLVWCKERKFI